MQTLESLPKIVPKNAIPCIHAGEKILLKIKYNGNPKTVNVCTDCVNVIKSSKICEVIQ